MMSRGSDNATLPTIGEDVSREMWLGQCNGLRGECLQGQVSYGRLSCKKGRKTQMTLTLQRFFPDDSFRLLLHNFC